MFCKSLIVFGLLAAFSVQGMEATQLDTRTVDLRALGDLIEQVKELIKNLNDIVSGVLENGLATLKGFIDTIKEIKEKFLNQAFADISNGFIKFIDFIASKTEEAGKLGINIAKCTSGKHEQLVDLAIAVAGDTRDCVSEPVSAALEMINNDLKIGGEIIKNITNLPAELAKCLVSLKPITCVNTMVTSLTKIVAELPGQIIDMINEVNTFVESLAETLGGCTSKISGNFNSKVDAMIDEISKCVDELIPEPTLPF